MFLVILTPRSVNDTKSTRAGDDDKSIHTGETTRVLSFGLYLAGPGEHVAVDNITKIYVRTHQKCTIVQTPSRQI